MSQLKPTILMNPQYATNNIDNQQAGFYQLSPNTSNLALRVNYSNMGIKGEVRLNTTTIPHVFQGNNGSAWVNFNALTGATGAPGQDFTNAVNFNNLGANASPGTVVPLASVFATTYVDVSSSISNVNIRSLSGGNYQVNSNLSLQSLVLSQNSNVITATSQPIPYKWDFTNGANTITNLKNSPSDANFYSWGETSRWIVQQGASITKGQAVRLTKDVSSSNIVITPISYTSLSGINPFTTPFNMLGIATQTASSGGTCIVCTKGITTALCTTNIDNTPPSNFLYTLDISNVGLDGIVGRDGGVFCNTQPSPSVDYIRAGYFLEAGSGIASNGQYVLFYVDPKVQLG